MKDKSKVTFKIKPIWIPKSLRKKWGSYYPRGDKTITFWITNTWEGAND